MSAIRLARGVTARDRIIKFAGCYHGHADALLVQAGSGALTHGVPSSPGVPAVTVAHTEIAQYNNAEQVQEIFTAAGRRDRRGHRRADRREHGLHPAGAGLP